MKKTLFLSLLLAGPAFAQDLGAVARASTEIRTFLQLVSAAEMDDVLKNAGPYTVFAPANSAFLSMPPSERENLLSDKEAARRAVADHIVPGKVVVADVKPGKTETIDGSKLSVQSDNGLVKVENASVILSDIKADNGVIHVVDTLIKPSE